ncbi:MAG: Hsp20/alpha crystallin family protein [Christensenellales bacterium]
MTIIPYTVKRVLPGAGLGIWGVPMLRTDIRETDDAYLLEIEMPGVKKEDIELICEGDVLTIAVKGRELENASGYVMRERLYGEMKRGFILKNIDGSTISAKLENGVLLVTLPKKKRESGRIHIE